MIRQEDFVAAVLDPARPTPPGLTGPDGRPAGRRFDVYRNNVAVSLTEALETGFPVVRKLVGPDWFRAMAGVFLRAHPPASPLLMFYGAEMPRFLQDFPPARDLPYLPDIARLELALRTAYHAADADAFDPARLARVPPDRLEQVVLGLAPAVTVLRSPYPVHAIWLANTARDAPRPSGGAQAVLITRPGFDPLVDLVGPGEATFVESLAAGAPFGEAAARAEADGTFDFTAALTRLLTRSAITQLQESLT
jgi:hypothetical protein